MSTIRYVQGDQRPALRLRLQSADGSPIDISAFGIVVRAHVRFDGQFKETILGSRVSGTVVSVDRRTGAWEVDTTPPYDLPGKGGIVVFMPTPTTFNQPGDYEVEYEIDWGSGVKQTVYQADRVNVREQFA